MSDDDFFASFDVDVDDSAALARQQRIAAARQAGKSYSAKVDSPSWFLDPEQAGRSKGPARPALFALHLSYAQGDFKGAMEGALGLLREGGIKEEQEAVDLVLRSAVRVGGEAVRRREVVECAKRWRDFPNLPSLSFVAARVLFANSFLSTPSTSSSSSTPPSSAAADLNNADAIPPSEVLSASLSSLRLHPTHPFFAPLLSRILFPLSPILSSGVPLDPAPGARKKAQGALNADPTRRRELEGEVERLAGETGMKEAERETLRRVLGLEGAEGGEEEEEGAGRDVRSL
ncbi:hypothetical protein JCM8097_000470 [Rhodosporidiobolus ruineniae]